MNDCRNCGDARVNYGPLCPRCKETAEGPLDHGDALRIIAEALKSVDPLGVHSITVSATRGSRMVEFDYDPREGFHVILRDHGTMAKPDAWKIERHDDTIERVAAFLRGGE